MYVEKVKERQRTFRMGVFLNRGSYDLKDDTEPTTRVAIQ